MKLLAVVNMLNRDVVVVGAGVVVVVYNVMFGDPSQQCTDSPEHWATHNVGQNRAT